MLLPQPILGKFGPLFQDGPLFQPMFGPLFQGVLLPQNGMFGPLFHGALLPHTGPLFQLNGIFEPLPQDGPLLQPMFGPPPQDGPLPQLKPLPGPLPHDWLLPQFMLGLQSKLSKPQPPALTLPAALASKMPAIIFFMVSVPFLIGLANTKQAG